MARKGEQGEAKQGEGAGVRERVRDLTAGALSGGRFDREAIRDAVRAIAEGAAAGAAGGDPGARRSLAEALRGMDQALSRSFDAGQQAIRRLVESGRGVSERELRQALDGLQKIEEDFIATFGQLAESASARARPDLQDALVKASRAGTETGREAAAAMTEFTQRFAGASVELGLAGVELAGEFGARFAQIAGGMLAGMADAIDKAAAETKKNP